MTKKKALIIPLLLALAFAVVPAMAKNKTSNSLTIPEKALDSEGRVFDLGTATDPATGKTVQGYAIVKYKDKNARPDHAGGPKNSGGGATCYGFLAKGAKWKSAEPWVVNGSNSEGLDPNFILLNESANISKWESAAGGNILGNGSLTSATLVADTSAPDNKNEVYFADISSQGAIGVTIVWGIFIGPPQGRELVEWDQVYDDTDFDWGIGDPTKMDFENISTHELGHTFGLADLYDSACAQETMYGYASEGDTNKRTLEAGDIAGVSSLYN